MKKLSLNLRFAGAVLPIITGPDGLDRVPVKPIANLLGLNWNSQMKSLKNPHKVRRLGVLTLNMDGSAPDIEVKDGSFNPDIRVKKGNRGLVICILVKRVEKYLDMINPDKVRVAGNADGADFLEMKQEEWSDVIHDYEKAKGDMTKVIAPEQHLKLKQINALTNVSRTMKRYGSDPYLEAAQQELGNDLGFDIAIQQELPTGTAS